MQELDTKITTPIQEKIYNTLKEKGELTRSGICKEFNYMLKGYKFKNKRKNKRKNDEHIVFLHKQRTTIYDNLDKLMKKGLVEKHTQETGKKGRPPTYWKIKN